MLFVEDDIGVQVAPSYSLRDFDDPDATSDTSILLSLTNAVDGLSETFTINNSSGLNLERITKPSSGNDYLLQYNLSGGDAFSQYQEVSALNEVTQLQCIHTHTYTHTHTLMRISKHCLGLYIIIHVVTYNSRRVE